MIGHSNIAIEKPRSARFTPEKYIQLCKLGAFDGMRVQLIGNEVIEMPAQGNKHFATIDRIRHVLQGVFQLGYWVRAQGTLNLSPHGVPDPDIAVVLGDADHPADDNPTTALLIVEISDSRLLFDRTTKASMYAAAGIEDYWIVNVPDRQLEIRRGPQPDATEDFGHGYASLLTLKPGENAMPLAMPGGMVPVNRLFF